MSHSTHVGFNGPGMCSLSGRLLPWCPIEDDFQSLVVVGVGHMPERAMTASDEHVLRPIRAFMAMCASKDFPSSFATGVGHSTTALRSPHPAFVPLTGLFVFP